MPVECYFIESRWRNRIALCVFCVILFLALLDNHTKSLLEAFALFGVVVLSVLDTPGRNGRVNWSAVGRRLLFVGIALAAIVLFGEWMRGLAGPPDVTRREAFGAFFEYHGAVVLALSLWLFAPIGIGWARLVRCVATRQPRPPIHWIMYPTLLVVLFAAWSFVTAFSSMQPERSFRYFATEIGVYAPLFLFWVRHASREASLQKSLKRTALVLFAVTVLIGSVTAGAYLVGTENMRKALTDESSRPMIKKEFMRDGYEWRLNAPFGHHNRMGYFSALAVLFIAFHALGSDRASRRWLFAALALLSLFNLGCTLNRGATLALAASAILVGAIALRRKAVWFVPLVTVALFLVTPREQKEHILTVFQRETYTSDLSTVNMRFRHWMVAVSLIRENPLMGVGYGWQNYSVIHYQRGLEMQVDLGLDHAHNIWLQIAGESGIPAALIFLLWSATRWGLIAWLLARRKSLQAADMQILLLWIALETTIQLYSLSNLPLRRSLGHITWNLWAIMSVDLLLMACRAGNPFLSGRPVESSGGNKNQKNNLDKRFA